MFSAFLSLMFCTELAASVIDADINPMSLLVIYGPMGAMLAWFMLRSERSMNNLSHQIDGMTRAMLVDILSRDTVNPLARRHAEEMLVKIEARDERRKPYNR